RRRSRRRNCVGTPHRRPRPPTTHARRCSRVSFVSKSHCAYSLGAAVPPRPAHAGEGAFAHGMPPHGGFAIGLERWTSRLIRAENIREVTLFPRDLHRLTP